MVTPNAQTSRAGLTGNLELLVAPEGRSPGSHMGTSRASWTKQSSGEQKTGEMALLRS